MTSHPALVQLDDGKHVFLIPVPLHLPSHGPMLPPGRSTPHIQALGQGMPHGPNIAVRQQTYHHRHHRRALGQGGQPMPRTRRRTPEPPQYPQVHVRVPPHDLHIAIGRVAVALRRNAGDDAADAFNAAAHRCLAHAASPHEAAEAVLALIKRTVPVRVS
jgi:hypothetical protein